MGKYAQITLINEWDGPASPPAIEVGRQRRGRASASHPAAKPQLGLFFHLKMT